MKIVKTVSAFAVLMAGITALLYLTYFEPCSSSPQKRPGVATVIETQSSIPDQLVLYCPSGNPSSAATSPPGDLATRSSS
jgi:hypothetical protein